MMVRYGDFMIDLTQLRKDPQRISMLIARKDPNFPIQELCTLDNDLRQVRLSVESLRQQKNELASQAKSGITEQIRNTSIAISKQLKQEEEKLESLERTFQELYLHCPNIPDEEIPQGFKEANKVIKVVGEKPLFSFPVKNHLELGTALGWLDFQAACVMAGANFPLYKDDAVLLLYALTMLMLKNNMKHGFKPVMVPYVVNEQSLVVASNFPKFKDQVYHITQDGLYLIPTSEVSLASMYRDHIFQIKDLPVRMTSWSSCFRREAGGYGATERGLIRIHQFEKLELFTLCEAEKSAQEQERMLTCAEDILQQLGLHYRISLLAAQDCSFPSAKTYDIEVWLPGQQTYYEVSSISNCTDFQARRGAIRYRKQVEGKPDLVHTLNGSSLALPRLMVALMETYQQADGTIDLPPLLKQQVPFV